MVDGTGKPLEFVLTAGQQHDSTVAEELLRRRQGAAVLADKGYDSNKIIDFIEQEMKATVVIPSRSNRTKAREIDRDRYKQRNAVERLFAWIKRYRRIATRYEKTAASYLGMLYLASILCWLSDS